MKRLWVVLAAFSVAALLSSCGGKIGPGSAKVQRKTVEGVKTGLVRLMTVPSFSRTSGMVESRNSSLVAAKIMGAVTSVRVDRGDRVKKGQILLTIEAAGARQHVDQARQAVQEARDAAKMAHDKAALAGATYSRYKKLYEEKALTAQEFDEISTRRAVALTGASQANAALARAQAALAAARTYLGYATVRAPINGIVTEKKVDVGSMATPGTPLLVLEEPEYRIVAALDEHLLGKVKPGLSLMVRIPSAGIEDTVPITRVTPYVDPATRTFTVRARLPYSPMLQGGLYAKVLVPQGTKKTVMAPAAAIGRRGETEYAFAIGKDGVLELRAVRTGSTYKGYVEVLSGLRPGDRVTVSDFNNLSQGLRLVSAQ